METIRQKFYYQLVVRAIINIIINYKQNLCDHYREKSRFNTIFTEWIKQANVEISSKITACA